MGQWGWQRRSWRGDCGGAATPRAGSKSSMSNSTRPPFGSSFSRSLCVILAFVFRPCAQCQHQKLKSDAISRSCSARGCSRWAASSPGVEKEGRKSSRGAKIKEGGPKMRRKTAEFCFPSERLQTFCWTARIYFGRGGAV
eukprot:3936186-Rhodomonas_salina.1